MMKRLVHILTYCAITAVIAGCASSSPSRFYTLSSTSSAPAVAPQSSCSVSVGPVSVPAFLDRRQMVVKTGPNQVFIDEFNRWACPLKDDIGRAVIEDLVLLLGTTQVTPYNHSAAAGASYRVMIDVLRFDSEPGKAATVDALWSVRSVKDNQYYRNRITVTEATQGDDYAALVAAHSRALGQVSAGIAKKIQEMEAGKP